MPSTAVGAAVGGGGGVAGAREEVCSINSEIEECTDRLRDLVLQFESLKGDLSTAAEGLGAAPGGDSGAEQRPRSGTQVRERTAQVMERLAQHRAWAEERLCGLTARLHEFVEKYGDGADVVQAVLQAYARLSQLVTDLAANLHRQSLSIRDAGMSTTAQLTGGVADEARRQASVAAEAAEAQVRVMQEWGDAQAARLHATFERTWRGFGGEARQRAQQVHSEVSATIDALSGKLAEYRSMPDAAAMRRAVARDAEKTAQRVQWHVRRSFPVMGYTIDGTAEILSDPSRSLLARVWALALFILITFFHWARHQAHRVRDAALGDPARPPAHSACHS